MRIRSLAQIFLVSFVLVFIGCGKQPAKTLNINGHSGETAAISEADLDKINDQLNLAILLEDELGLKEVIVSQDGENLLIRCMAPTIKGQELYRGLVQVFAFINQKAPSNTKTMKLIFTINHVDSAIVEVPRQAVTRWMDNGISNQTLISRFTVTSLLK